MMIEYFTRFLFPERDKLAEEHGVAPEEAEVAAPIDNANDINTQWAYADADRAMALVRLGAAKWGINPDKIGIMGFSAGSMTAMNQALHHSELTRPNFVGAIYTGVAEGFEVPADAAPLFMCSPVNDIFQPQETFRVLKPGVPPKSRWSSTIIPSVAMAMVQPSRMPPATSGSTSRSPS